MVMKCGHSKGAIVGLVSLFGFLQALIHTGLTSANLTTVSSRYGLSTLEAGVLVAMLEVSHFRAFSSPSVRLCVCLCAFVFICVSSSDEIVEYHLSFIG